jgi:Gly-Xaa carboxypeptidase
MDELLKDLVLKSTNSDEALQELEIVLLEQPSSKAQLGTTQAVDIIGGGIKSNALPENAWTIVNHRLSQLRLSPVCVGLCMTDGLCDYQFSQRA